MKSAAILALAAVLLLAGCDEAGAPAPGVSDPSAVGKAAEQKGGEAPKGMSADDLVVPDGAGQDSGFGSAIDK
jgi:uncharacterized lipoprotein